MELDGELAQIAADALKTTTLVFDAFHDVEQLAQAGNAKAREVMESWANAEWFTSREPLQEKITVTVFKVTGETNTDDLSPAPDAWSRPDIPLHALAMLKNPRDGIDHEDVAGQIAGLKEQGFPLAYVGDVVGTGSSRKSATNSVLWYMGDDVRRGVPCLRLRDDAVAAVARREAERGASRRRRASSTPSTRETTACRASTPSRRERGAISTPQRTQVPCVPNKRAGSVCIGGKIAPIFFNTMEDAGALPLEMDVTQMNMGDVIDVYPFEGVAKRHGTDEVLAKFQMKTNVIQDEVRAGGRIPLIIGRGLTAKARASLGMEPSTVFQVPGAPEAPPGLSLIHI